MSLEDVECLPQLPENKPRWLDLQKSSSYGRVALSAPIGLSINVLRNYNMLNLILCGGGEHRALKITQ